jgi:hypothetical protein
MLGGLLDGMGLGEVWIDGGYCCLNYLNYYYFDFGSN